MGLHQFNLPEALKLKYTMESVVVSQSVGQVCRNISNCARVRDALGCAPSKSGIDGQVWAGEGTKDFHGAFGLWRAKSSGESCSTFLVVVGVSLP